MKKEMSNFSSEFLWLLKDIEVTDVPLPILISYFFLFMNSLHIFERPDEGDLDIDLTIHKVLI